MFFDKKSTISRVFNETFFPFFVSTLSVPTPDGGVVADGDQDAAVAAEAGLPDGRRAFG